QSLPARTDPREAAAAGDLILPSRTIAWGDCASAFDACAFVVSGRADSGGQEHLYLETQGAFAERRDSGSIFVLSSTQSPTGVQKAVAAVLGLPYNKVEVEARRLGGAFGGKEDQAAPWAALTALGSWVTGRPVRLYLNRHDDMVATGKRHPYSSDFRIGADAEGRILAFQAEYYQNSGCTCDLSPAILSRTLLHATGAYRIPNVRVTGYMCRTNLPSFTAFRGFGAPQAFFAIESALDALAVKMGKPRELLQRMNLFQEGDSTHFGMKLKSCRAGEAYGALLEECGWEDLQKDIGSFNASSSLKKRGAAIIPICFGISFTKLTMNRAGALVHVYADGSVLVSTGAVEMGQQVSRKIARVVAKSLGVPLGLVRVERTSTLTVANTVPTAASTGADLNGMAAKLACDEILSRLRRKAAQMLGADLQSVSIAEGRVNLNGTPSGLDWARLVAAADEERIDLSAHGFWATPGLVYDATSERGRPFAYHVYGAACVVAELDVVLGRARLLSCTIAHDSGKSLDPEVDLGQIEGALAQGLGWTLLEDLRFGADGKPLTDSLSTYKVPDADFLPADTKVSILPPTENPEVPFNSKAVGEPPLQYGIAAYFAILQAIRAARPGVEPFYSIPLIPEKIEAALSGEKPC
ncbi:MAG TPA: molybdopterin cofactor-binding domain-containing protein, partial [Rectinemataceae bacterium]